jgi:large subunit ribosomal protein L3
MKFILGKKLSMTQVFREDGTVVPVTRVSAGPCVVTQVKTKEKDGVGAVQLGFGKQALFRLHKAKQGHLKDLSPVRFLREIRTDGEEQGLKRGDEFTVKIFEPGDKVQVIGKSKGKGFQGVVKRHGFSGSPASHGHKDQLRMPGSIGATDPARVFKGTRMAGHMGDNQVTVKNLEIVEVHPEQNELLIKGAIPGARGGLLIISSADGMIEIKEVQPETPDEKVETAPAEEADASEKTETSDMTDGEAVEQLDSAKATASEEEKKEAPAEEKEAGAESTEEKKPEASEVEEKPVDEKSV